MKNREYVREAYDEIHAPEALFGKIMDRKKESNMRNVLKYAVAAFGVFALTFVTSNAICYAATGETWVKKAIIYINGEETEADMIWTQEGDALVGRAEMDTENGAVTQVIEVPDASDDLEVENVVIEITDTNVDEYEIELNGK